MTERKYTIRWAANSHAISGTEASIRRFIKWNRDHDQSVRCVTSRKRANAVEAELERQLEADACNEQWRKTDGE